MARPTLPADDPRVGALFLEPPERFVSARDSLFRELAGARDPAASAVKALRRPTRRVWLLNRLARQQAEGVTALIESGGRLRRAHALAVGGRPDAGLRDADEELRRRVDALVRRVPALLGEAGRRGSDAALISGLAEDLRALATGAGDVDAFRAGVLDRGPSSSADDALEAALAASTATPAAPRTAEPSAVHHGRAADRPGPGRIEDRRGAAGRARADREEGRRRAAERARAEREERRHRAAERARLEREVKRARGELDAAEVDVGRREAAAARAEREAARLRGEAEAARAARDAARQALARAEAAAREASGPKPR